MTFNKKEYDKEYRKKNRAKINESWRKWAEKNKQHRQALARKSYHRTKLAKKASQPESVESTSRSR